MKCSQGLKLILMMHLSWVLASEANTEPDKSSVNASWMLPDVPNPPRIVDVQCNDKYATIKWLPLGDNRSPIVNFIIQYNTSFIPDLWVDIGKVPPFDWSYNAPLHAWNNYTFRVIAVNKIGQSLPSSHSEVCTQNSEAPEKNPDNVKGERARPDNLVITWTPMPQIEHAGPGFKYVVCWKRDIPDNNYECVDIDDFKQNRYVVQNQPTFVKYIINVFSANELGQCRISPQEVVGYSGGDKPTETPANFTTLLAITGAKRAVLSKTEPDEASVNASWMLPDVPNPPRMVDVQCNDKYATIKWLPLGDNRSPFLNFIIQYNTSFIPELWVDIGKVPPFDWTYNAPLHAWNNYTFRVIAVNKIGQSLPSSHSEVCTQNSEVPQKNPENVKGEGDRPDNLVITWTPMPQNEHAGPGFKYVVCWKRYIPNNDYECVKIHDFKQNRYVVENQPTFVKYIIKVFSENELGQCRISPQEVVGYSGGDVPTEAPTNITLLAIIGAKHALLSWTQVPAESVRGHFKGYKIKTWSGTTPTPKETMISKDSTKALITTFDPYSWNYAQVYVFNQQYNGPPSEIVSFQTPEGVPEDFTSLKVYPLGSTGFYLKWEKPKLPSGILTGYNIYWSKISSAMTVDEPQPRKPQITDPNVMSVKLSGFVPNTKYRIYITAYTKAGESRKFFVDTSTFINLQNIQKPSKPTFTWEILNVYPPVSVKIQWIPNVEGIPGDHFFVKYRKIEDNNWQESVHEQKEDWIIISSLDNKSVYEFIVVSVDSLNPHNYAESDKQTITA